jgi:hypothetical protein
MASVTVRTTGASWVVETGGEEAVSAVWDAIEHGRPLTAHLAGPGAEPGDFTVILNPAHVIHVAVKEE